MSRQDWLIGKDRHSAGAETIYKAATELIAQRGYDALSIEALAAATHCSPATIYRRAGGKAAIRDAVIRMQANRILVSVREAIADRQGADRVVTATLVALQRIRSDPLIGLMAPERLTPRSDWLTTSPVIAGFAAEMLGPDNDDPLAAQWLVRAFLALLCWPFDDPDAERRAVERFLGI